MSNRKLSRISVVDLVNANYLVLALRSIGIMEKGVTRALGRIMEWICHDHKTIRFAVKLKPFANWSIKDNGLWMKVDNIEYGKYRASRRHVTRFEDEVLAEEGKLPLINNEQFQFRLLDWAREVTTDFNRWWPVTKHPFQLILSYVEDTDGDEDGTIFYVPRWELITDQPWGTFSTKEKKVLAEVIEYMANAIDDMYHRMGWLNPEEEERALHQLRHLQADSEEEEQRAIASYREDHDPAAVLTTQVKPQPKKHNQARKQFGKRKNPPRERLPDPVKGSHLDIDRALKDWNEPHGNAAAVPTKTMSESDTSEVFNKEISRDDWQAGQSMAYAAAADTSFSLPA